MKSKPWIFRTYAGHSTAKASNKLFRENLKKGMCESLVVNRWNRSMHFAVSSKQLTGVNPFCQGQVPLLSVWIGWAWLERLSSWFVLL